MVSRPFPYLFDCGCSIHKVRMGLCSVYLPSGESRYTDPKWHPRHVERWWRWLLNWLGDW